MISVADSLAVLEPHLPTALLSPRGRDDIRAIAEHMPATLCACFGFEVVLGDPRARADFAMQVMTRHGWGALAQLGDGSAGPGGLGHAGAWDRIRRLARWWCEDGSSLAAVAPGTWLEFDVDPRSPLHRLPAVFLGVDPRAGAEGRLPLPLQQGVELVAGASLSPAGETAVARCLGELPDDARLLQIGTMLSRRQVPVRLCLSGVRPEALDGYLRRVGLGAASGALDDLAADLPGVRLAVDVDIVDGILPRVGLELSLDANRELDGRPEPRWADVLDRLVARGLCTVAKRDGVLAWAGADDAQFAHTAHRTRVYRGLSHVKLALGADGERAAKAYIGILPDRLTMLFADTAIDEPPATPAIRSGV